VAVPFADGRGKNLRNVFDRQVMFRYMLNVAFGIVGWVPYEAGVFHPPILRITP
jgi:hypothetical protein